MTTYCLTVTGGGSVGECDRLSHYNNNIVILIFTYVLKLGCRQLSRLSTTVVVDGRFVSLNEEETQMSQKTERCPVWFGDVLDA